MKHRRPRGPSAKALPQSNRLAIFAFILIVFPLYFWFTVFLKFQLGLQAPFRFWDYFYEDYIEFFLILLPLPALIFGVIAYFRGRKRHLGAALSALTVLASLITGIIWFIAAQRPS